MELKKFCQEDLILESCRSQKCKNTLSNDILAIIIMNGVLGKKKRMQIMMIMMMMIMMKC